MGDLFRPDPLYFARHRDLRRRRHVHAWRSRIESVPLPVALALSGIVGFLFALLVGPSTLRLRGVYFVIFTFGLTELMRQLVSWYEINVTNKVNRFIEVSIDAIAVYEMLLVLAFIAVVGSWYLSTSRLGHALRAIGEDETVARHTGIDTTWVKVLVFAVASALMALVGGVYALRYPSIDPTVGFSNNWSFTVLIGALLGGPGRWWGPALGAILLVLLSDFLVGNFSQYFTIALGTCFVVIVYFIPGGVAPRLEQLYRMIAQRLPARPSPAPESGSGGAGRRVNAQGCSSAAVAALSDRAAHHGSRAEAYRTRRQPRRPARCSASMVFEKRSAASSPCATSPSMSLPAASPA